jgi:hypothetical protein
MSDYQLLDMIIAALETLDSYDRTDKVELKDIAKDYLTEEEVILINKYKLLK